ncbi:hypothetical protein [Agromyces sp. NPDC055658]
MKSVLRIGSAVAIASIALGLFVASPATAADRGNGKDKGIDVERALALNEKYLGASEEALAKIPAADLALLQEAGKLADVKVTSEVKLMPAAEAEAALAEDGVVTPMAANYCYSVTQTYVGRSAVGIDLYKSWTRGRWCTGATTVTGAAIEEQGGQTFFLGWKFNGKINGGSGVVSGRGVAWSQHSFQYQLGTPIPTQYTQPCTRVRGNFTGTYYRDYVCSLY